MNDPRPGLSEDDLHAYVDGLLDDERRREVEAWLAADPEAAARAAQWRRQNAGLEALFGGKASALPGDAERVAQLMRPPRRRFGWFAAAAAVVMFIAGTATGRLTASVPTPSQDPVELAASLPREAGAAHLIYASEVRHPVEVGADEEAHLVAWLGKKLDHPLTTPDLAQLGYHLVGGRLVPTAGRSGALLMYEDAAGERLTLLVGQNVGNRETGFRYASEGAVETFYWIDGPLGYAISGEVERSRLQTVADEIYRQLEAGPAPEG